MDVVADEFVVHGYGDGEEIRLGIPGGIWRVGRAFAGEGIVDASFNYLQ